MNILRFSCVNFSCTGFRLQMKEIGTFVVKGMGTVEIECGCLELNKKET